MALAALILGILFTAGSALAGTSWDFEDGTQGDWYVSEPRGTFMIQNVVDADSGSRVIELTASTINNWFAMGAPGQAPLNETGTTAQWSLKSSAFFYVYVEVDTPAGVRYLYYTPGKKDGLLEGTYVHHALGNDADDGSWRSFSRDLDADLNEAEPGNTITDVNRFLVRGTSVRLDDMAIGPAGPASGDASLSGSVSGAILMVIAGNLVVATYDTDGMPLDVDTNGDGIPDARSFTLTGLPTDVPIQVYLMENGQIYPLVLVTGPGTGTNTFSLSTNDPIDLGFVMIATGIAIPQNNPAGTPGVTTLDPDPVVPSVLYNPSTAGMPLDELLDAGFSDLSDNWHLRARTYFKAAVELTGDTPGNDRDVANLFYAGTRMVSLWLDTYPGADPNVLESLGDILDAFGFQFDFGLRGSLHNIHKLDLENDIPADCPTGAELQDFFENIVRPEVEEAIANLNAVSPTVLKTWEAPLLHNTVISDYADVLMLRAACKAFLAALQIQYFYDLDADIYGLIHGGQTMQSLLAGTFLSPKNPGADLQASKALLISALDDAVKGMGLVRQRPGDPHNFLLGLFGFTPECAALAQMVVSTCKTALEGNINFNLAGEFLVDINAPVFFTGLDVNALAMPFTGNHITGLFPDPTFGGIFPLGFPITFPNDLFGLISRIPIPIEMDFNFDGINTNSVPDIVELFNSSHETLILMQPEEPDYFVTWLVTQGYDLLFALWGDTVGDTDVAAVAEAALDFVPTAVIYAVAEFALTMEDQFCGPLFPPIVP